VINDFLSSGLAWRLGWTLLHSLWQFLLIWAAVGVGLKLLARRSANARYLIACCGIVAMCVSLAATFVLIPPRPAAHHAATARTATEAFHTPPDRQVAIEPLEATQVSLTPGPAPNGNRELIDTSDVPLRTDDRTFSMSFTEFITPWLPWIVGAWLVGVILFALWNLGGWIVVQRLRNRGIIPVASHTHERMMQ
jgi:hypothetical protein